jgi:hypothetical protein
MEPDEARRRLLEGGVMLCMDVPQGGPKNVDLMRVYLCGVVCESVRERSFVRK